MLFPRDRKLARPRGRWPRIVAVVGLAAFSCTLPDYQFDGVDPDTCTNDVLDGNETQVDCGGSCDPCTCEEDEDCTGVDQVCVDGACVSSCQGGECGPTCVDGETNGDETDEDCGGSCPADCAVGDHCKENSDCEEKVCDGTKCLAAACDDGVKNGSEPAIDCGGECNLKCPNDTPCNSNKDCESATCGDNGKCVKPLCDNGKVDAGESDVDCGGDECPSCNVGDDCNEADDCSEKVCGDDGTCSKPRCDDGAENGVETDTDCGGSTGCPRCDDDATCEKSSDCRSKICTDDKKCQEATCDDGVTNGDESDQDCGGSCSGCPLGGDCDEDGDCAAPMTCDLGSDDPHCVSCDDGEQNGSELGPDCGGSDCELCQPGDICSADAACLNYLCNDNDRCAPGLTIDYRCGQCGGGTSDHIKFFLILHNLSSAPIDVSDVAVRYYLSTQASEQAIAGFTFECKYEGTASCGAQKLTPYTPSTNSATHVFETVLGVTEEIAPMGSAEVELTIQLKGTSMTQSDDYSFTDGSVERYEHVTLHRRGTRIWGNEP